MCISPDLNQRFILLHILYLATDAVVGLHVGHLHTVGWCEGPWALVTLVKSHKGYWGFIILYLAIALVFLSLSLPDTHSALNVFLPLCISITFRFSHSRRHFLFWSRILSLTFFSLFTNPLGRPLGCSEIFVHWSKPWTGLTKLCVGQNVRFQLLFNFV